MKLLHQVFDPTSPYYVFPKEMPRMLIYLLVAACLLVGLSGLRHGTGWQGWLHVLENWVFMLVLIPSATAIIALPVKYRDPSFELKLAYYMGMFVAVLFVLSKLRYWR